MVFGSNKTMKSIPASHNMSSHSNGRKETTIQNLYFASMRYPFGANHPFRSTPLAHAFNLLDDALQTGFPRSDGMCSYISSALSEIPSRYSYTTLFIQTRDASLFCKIEFMSDWTRVCSPSFYSARFVDTTKGGVIVHVYKNTSIQLVMHSTVLRPWYWSYSDLTRPFKTTHVMLLWYLHFNMSRASSNLIAPNSSKCICYLRWSPNILHHYGFLLNKMSYVLVLQPCVLCSRMILAAVR